MPVGQPLHIFIVPAADHRGNRITLLHAGLQHKFIALKQAGVGQGQFAQPVGVMRINTGIVQLPSRSGAVRCRR